MAVGMRMIGPEGEYEARRFPGTSALSLAMKLLMHPTYTVIVCESDDWYSDIEVEVDAARKVIRLREQPK
jgi:hypothetical protein